MRSLLDLGFWFSMKFLVPGHGLSGRRKRSIARMVGINKLINVIAGAGTPPGLLDDPLIRRPSPLAKSRCRR